MPEYLENNLEGSEVQSKSFFSTRDPLRRMDPELLRELVRSPNFRRQLSAVQTQVSEEMLAWRSLPSSIKKVQTALERGASTVEEVVSRTGLSSGEVERAIEDLYGVSERQVDRK